MEVPPPSIRPRREPICCRCSRLAVAVDSPTRRSIHRAEADSLPLQLIRRHRHRPFVRAPAEGRFVPTRCSAASSSPWRGLLRLPAARAAAWPPALHNGSTRLGGVLSSRLSDLPATRPPPPPWLHAARATANPPRRDAGARVGPTMVASRVTGQKKLAAGRGCRARYNS